MKSPVTDSFLQGFTEAGRKLFLASARRRNLSRGEVLFREGEEGSAVYVLERGKLQVYKLTPEGKEISIRVIRPGELFGEVVIFEATTYPATATAIADSTVLTVPSRVFERLLDRREFRNEFIRILLRKERYLAEKIRELVAAQVEERFVSFLRQHYGVGDTIRITLTKREIARSIGATPETFSRMLARLKAQGRLVWQKGSLRLEPGLWKRWAPS